MGDFISAVKEKGLSIRPGEKNKGSVRTSTGSRQPPQKKREHREKMIQDRMRGLGDLW